MLDSKGQSPVDLVHLILHQSSILGWTLFVPLGDIPPQLSVSVPFSKSTDPSTRDSAITKLRSTYAFPLQVLAPLTPKGGVAIERPHTLIPQAGTSGLACRSAGVSYSSSHPSQSPSSQKVPNLSLLTSISFNHTLVSVVECSRGRAIVLTTAR